MIYSNNSYTNPLQKMKIRVIIPLYEKARMKTVGNFFGFSASRGWCKPDMMSFTEYHFGAEG